MTHTRVALVMLALSFATPVLAADPVYEQPPIQSEQSLASAYDWSGFYLGAQGGYNWNKAKISGDELNLDSGAIGGHAGYNFQYGNIVLGVENNFNYNLKDSSRANVEWDASGRGRVGYAWDRTLVFATAGVAAAGTKVDVPGLDKKDGILIGWTAGAGLEHALTDHFLIRSEYRYSGFGDKDLGSAVGDVGAQQHKVLLGASYKF